MNLSITVEDSTEIRNGVIVKVLKDLSCQLSIMVDMVIFGLRTIFWQLQMYFLSMWKTAQIVPSGSAPFQFMALLTTVTVDSGTGAPTYSRLY